jgi:hypothetical protein
VSAQPPQPQQQLNVVIPPDEFPGHWANLAQLQRTPHEFTLDFIRVGPQGQFGQVVSRINFSPLLLYQLVDLLNAHWRAYTEEAGPPEGAPDDA